MKVPNNLNAKLLSSINAAGKIHMVPANLGDKYVIRFCVCAQNATEAHIGKPIFLLFEEFHLLTNIELIAWVYIRDEAELSGENGFYKT